MSKTSSVDAILTQASMKEKEHDWLGAAETYAKGLDSISAQDFSSLGDLHERLGYAFRKAAMQVEDVNEFKNRMNKAAAHYGKALEAYERISDSETAKAKGLRCSAAKAYVEHWLAADSSEKKKWLDECWKLATESMRTFEKGEERSEFAKTYLQLSDAAIFLFTREPDFKSREKVIQEAVESGEKTINFLSPSGDACQLAMAYARTVVFLGVFSYNFIDINEREKYREEGLNHWSKAKQLSEETAMTESMYPVFGGQIFFGLEGSDEAFENCTKALEYGRKMNDKFIIGCALDWLVYHTAWKLYGTDDPAEKERIIERCLKYAEESLREFSKVPFISPRGDLVWTRAGIEPIRLSFQIDFETDPKKKRALDEEIFQWGLRNRNVWEEPGYPEIMMAWYGGRGMLCQKLAKSETDPVKRKKGLEEALAYINKAKGTQENLVPFQYWNIGIMRSLLASVECELAEVTGDSEKKKTLLGAAVADKQKAIELCLREFTYFVKKGSGTSLFVTIGAQHYGYAHMLVRLYELTGEKEHLKKAVQSYDASTDYYQKLSLVSRIAENCWRKAQVFDKLGEHLAASQEFECAAQSYASALEKYPQLKAFYNDHALYMQAWSEIEKARFHHNKQEYNIAEEHFDKAANLHKSLKRWNYLSPNYSAWAKLDEAEELSRKENSEEALQAFEAASSFFEETRQSLDNQLPTIEDTEEKEMAAEMLRATGLRHQYCAARVAVEQAKIFDKKGDHFSSSEKYSSAAEILEGIQEAVQTERDKKEFKLIATLSQAWAKMTLAEAEESPGLYAEASQLFEKAKELSPSEKAKTLALGHSRFCRALEAGMKFSDTADEKLHNAAVQQLESAAKYYVKAGIQSASEYAKATELLLDAYSNINNAKKEADPERKTKLFAMAQKILQSSAGSFMKAEHPEKREQVLRLLDKVKEEQELAMSLSEVLHTPAIVSTTTAFSTPNPNHENAVGIEKFENANLQANIISRQKKLKVGENLDLEIEIVNAGKGPALLIKITELIPKGFELAENPGAYRVEDNYLNMKGKRVDPLKTEEVKLKLKPKVQGEFSLRPTVLYLDENGQYKSHQPEPLTLTVTELGITGWLKGER